MNIAKLLMQIDSKQWGQISKEIHLNTGMWRFGNRNYIRIAAYIARTRLADPFANDWKDALMADPVMKLHLEAYNFKNDDVLLGYIQHQVLNDPHLKQISNAYASLLGSCIGFSGSIVLLMYLFSKV